MTSSIGSHDFITLQGVIDLMGKTTANITRPVVDGFALHEFGERSRQKTITGIIDLADEAAVKSTIQAYKLLQNTFQTITDDLGNTWSNVFIHNVELLPPKYVDTPVGGENEGNYLLTSKWTVQASESTA